VPFPRCVPKLPPHKLFSHGTVDGSQYCSKIKLHLLVRVLLHENVLLFAALGENLQLFDACNLGFIVEGGEALG
jgi:hypothetical protein